MLLFVGTVGWCLLLYSEFRQSGLFAAAPASTYATTGNAEADVPKSDLMGT